MMSFRNLKLINPIIRAATEEGYSKPTEMQSLAIPHILAGKDVMGCAQTGTGKTAAFVMSIVQLLKRGTPDHKEIRILILAPTQEIVIQIEDIFRTYSKYLPLSLLSVFEGVPIGGQLAALRKRVDILVATPERLLSLINQRHIDLSKIEILVLDKADKMLDTGCIGDVKNILKLLPRYRQTLLFSTIISINVRKFAQTILNKPIEVVQIEGDILQTIYSGEKKDQVDIPQSKNIRQPPFLNNTRYLANKAD